MGEKYKEILDKMYGQRMMIVGKHPHTGQIGKVEEIQDTLGGVGYVIRLDNGESCFVFKAENIQWLE